MSGAAPGGATAGGATTGGATTGGVCHVMFAFEVGFAIDLAAVEKLLTEAERERIAVSRRNLGGSDFHPRPLRIHERMDSLTVAGCVSTGECRTTLYDFGAISVAFRIPISDSLDELLPLARALSNNAALTERAACTAARLVERIGPAIAKPRLVRATEDYVVYALRGRELGGAELQLDKPLIARILRAEVETLSQEETADAFAHTVRYGTRDVAIVDWNSALLMDDEPSGAISVLEYANTELLEMRHLDNELDGWLQEAYELSAQHLRWRRPLSTRIRRDASRLAELQIDAATIFEAVNNALKLYGDQYLARLHTAAVRRFHTEDYERSVLRKVETLESIYEKMRDNQAQVRIEILEWIIILLIAAEIALSLWRH